MPSLGKLQRTGFQQLDLSDTFSKHIFIALIASLFLFFGHYHTNNMGGHALFLPFNATSWIPVFFLIGTGFWMLGSMGELRYSWLTRMLFIGCILLTIPWFYLNSSMAESAQRIIGLWAGFFVFVVLQQFRFNRQQLLLLLLIILGGVWMETARYWWMMLSEFLETGVFPSRYEYGMFGVFQQRNVFASFIATGLVLSSYLLAHYKELRFAKWLTPVLLVAPLFMFQILVSSASRAGWYGAVVGGVLLLPILYRNTNKKLFCFWLVAWVGGYLISLLMVSGGDYVVPDKNIFSMAGPRTAIFPQVLAMFLAKPLFGVGYGNFEFNYIHFIAERFSEGAFGSPSVPETFHPHNEFLLWGVEGGIVPVIGMLVAAWAVWVCVYRLALLERLALIGLFIPLALHSQVEYPFYASVMHWMIFIILIHHVDSASGEHGDGRDNIRKTIGVPLRRLVQVVGVTVPLLATWFLITTVGTGKTYWRYMDRQTTLDSFANVTNSMVWQNRLNWAINSGAVVIGRDYNRPELVQNYIDWAPEILKQQPRPLFYEYLVLSHLILNQTEQANAVIEEFYYLFPNAEFSEIIVN